MVFFSFLQSLEEHQSTYQKKNKERNI